MKTAISLPDETFDRVSRRAKELGMSRSELFARAAISYLDELDAASTRNQIDSALERITSHDDSAEVAVSAGRQLLDDGVDTW